MNEISVKIAKLHSDVKIPERSSQEAACYDLRAHLSETILLKPMERRAVPTGLKVEIPEGYLLSVRPRSGLAIKEGITLINSPGTIDSDYRGEIKVLLVNLSDKPVEIKNDERIAQLILEKALGINWQEKTERELSHTIRGEGGFGSTGIN
ncbi:MAG: dUTP diphosphatase [Spirochaetia bacterium]|nr:dUTP diphosphatase [Spirochaetia bacterium]